MNDISNKKLLELELINERKKINKFLNNMSHELRTPLNGILGFIELLKKDFFGTLNTDQKQFVDQIQLCGKHLLDLINNLLNLSNSRISDFNLKLEPININEHLLNSVKMLGSQIHKKRIKVNFNLNDLDFLVMVDPSKFQEIILNLLSNAIKYTPFEGCISLKTQIDNDFIIIKISDNGIGIPKEDQSNIFDEFFQSDLNRDQSLGGIGIGLAITKKLVVLHGGKIWVESSEGNGSTFNISIPLKKSKIKNDNDILYLEKKETNINHDDFNESLIPKNTNNILIVEDESTNLLMLQKWFEAKGYKISFAENGLEAVSMVKDKSFDLILMDIKMPIINGIDATRIIRSIPQKSDIPIIIITALVGDKLKEKCQNVGCNDFINKPINLEVLDERINKLIVA